jgi:exopolysaccharide production protein ExoQ
VAFGRLKRPARVVAASALALALALAFLFLPEIEAAIGDLRSNVLKKDATLTGRTYLWQIAAQLTAERPWLGHGYYAFWRQGNLDAESLWRWGGIGSRSGFNFHNAYIEMGVDLGFIGQFILYASCAVVALLAAVRQVSRPSVPMAFFLSLQIVVYIRSYAETGLIAPFSLLTALWVGTAVYAISADGSRTSIFPAVRGSRVGRLADSRRPERVARRSIRAPGARI